MREQHNVPPKKNGDGVSGGHDSSHMNVEYGTNPDQQSFSCHCYLSDDKYHT